PRSEVDVAVIPVADSLSEPARRIARELRRKGLRTSTPLELKRLGKELAQADRAGARVAVILGQDEWTTGEVTIRDMVTGEQHKTPWRDTPAAVAGMLRG
ncbi:MAG: histidine--tRNA ligase, partial [Actinobacteria bacterium]|nr:histidine--tRNA ligase [Actinomycetota bacterium]